jgi:hypothetical protein
MSNREVSWEIVLCGALMTGMALMLWTRGPQPKAEPQKASASIHSFHLNLPEGPSCDADQVPNNPETAALPETPQVFIDKDLKINLKELKKLKGLKHLEVLSRDDQQKRMIIIRPGAKQEITISG